jgi:hypothetical protein
MAGWWKPALAAVSALVVAGSGIAIGLAMSSQSKESVVSTRQQAPTTTTRAACPSDPHPGKGYHYVQVTECGDDFKEVSANLTLPETLPKVDEHTMPPGHSLGEIAIQQKFQSGGSDCSWNGIEAGWNVGGGGPGIWQDLPKFISDNILWGYKGDPDHIRFFVFKTIGY